VAAHLGTLAPGVLVAEFATGFSVVRGAMSELGCRTTWLSEDFAGPIAAGPAECILLLVDRDTWFSSQLYSLFTAIEHRVDAPHRFLVVLEPCRVLAAST
jgi:hypothetical protein